MFYDYRHRNDRGYFNGPSWPDRGTLDPVISVIMSLIDYFLSFFEINTSVERGYMSMRDPSLRRSNDESAPKDVDDGYTLEREIMDMEKNRKEMIRKIGGEKYERLLGTLVKRKQKKYNNG